MKRLLSAALALTLLGGTAAYADPPYYRGYDHHNRGDYDNRGERDGWRGERDRNWHRHNNDAGAAIAVGIGILALAAIMASQDRERAQERAYYGDERRMPAERYDYRDDRRN